MTSPSADTPATSPQVRRSVLLLSLACFCSMATQRLCDAMLPELAREFDASVARAAQVVSLFAVVYGLAQFFYGSVGDRLGKFRVLTACTLACGGGCLMAASSASLEWLVAARAVSAVFAAAIIPMSLAWTGDAVAYDRRQETLARVGMGTTLGIVGGQLLGGVLTDTLGWRWAFVLMTALFLGVGMLLRADLRRQPRPPAGAPPASTLRQTLALLRDPWVRRMLAVSVAQGGAGFGIVAIVATHLHEVHGLSLASAGAIVALFGLGGMLYMATARWLIPRLGEHGLALLGGGGTAAAMLTVGLAPGWQPAPAAMLLGGFAFFMLHNTLQANATQMAPEARGLGVSMFATGLFFGQALGVGVASLLIDRAGTGAVMAGGALVLAGAAAYFSVQLRRRRGARAGA